MVLVSERMSSPGVLTMAAAWVGRLQGCSTHPPPVARSRHGSGASSPRAKTVVLVSQVIITGHRRSSQVITDHHRSSRAERNSASARASEAPPLVTGADASGAALLGAAAESSCIVGTCTGVVPPRDTSGVGVGASGDGCDSCASRAATCGETIPRGPAACATGASCAPCGGVGSGTAAAGVGVAAPPPSL